MADAFRIFRSITSRLILGLALGTTLLWCGGMVYAGYVAHSELNEAFDSALKEATRRLLPIAIDEALGHDDDDARVLNRLSASREVYLSYQLRDPSGRILLQANDAIFASVPHIATTGFRTARGYRLYTAKDDATGLTITVAETMKDRWETVIHATRGMLLSLVGLILLNTLVIFLVTHAAMRPVLRLSQDISTRGGYNLSPLKISDQPSELRPIADSVSMLVDRLRLALDSERAFAANSAHELRTPIAGALAQTQRMIGKLQEPEDLRRARDVESTLKRLAALAEKLMQLSRLDAGFCPGLQKIDLVPALDLVVDDCAKRLKQPGRLKYARHPDLQLDGRIDIDAFAIAVGNLLENAVKHGDPTAAVDVITESDGVVRIINSGKVIPPDLLSSLKVRYVRGQSRAPGAGLGLAIVDSIMRQVGGKLELLSPAIGREDGFEARLTLHSLDTAQNPGQNEKLGKRRSIGV